MAPRSRISPSAKVIAHVAPRVHNGIVDGRVLLLFIESQMDATAIVNLDEVELALFEVVIGVNLLIAIETHIRISYVAIAGGYSCYSSSRNISGASISDVPS